MSRAHSFTQIGGGPDPTIRGMMGNPVGSGEIRTTLINNPQVVGPPFTSHSNPWNVGAGHDPQDISGAFNANGRHAVDEGIHLPYTAKYCSDGSHYYLSDGDFVFVLKSDSQSSGECTIVNLGTLNILLREGYYQNAETWRKLREDPQWKDVVELSENDLYGSRWYDAYAENYDNTKLGNDSSSSSTFSRSGRSQNNGGGDDDDDQGEPHPVFVVPDPNHSEAAAALIDLTRRISSIRTNDPLFSAIANNVKRGTKESQTNWEIQRKSYEFWMKKKDLVHEGLRYLHAGTILDHWYPLGVVRTATNDVGQGYNRSGNRSSVELSVTISKKTYGVRNYWGPGLEIGHVLGFVLKRAKDTDGNYGPYQLYPVSNGNDAPSPSDREYEDLAGVKQLGRVIRIGYTSESLLKPASSQRDLATACGLVAGQTPEEAFKKAVLLENLTAHLV